MFDHFSTLCTKELREGTILQQKFEIEMKEESFFYKWFPLQQKKLISSYSTYFAIPINFKTCRY